MIITRKFKANLLCFGRIADEDETGCTTYEYFRLINDNNDYITKREGLKKKVWNFSCFPKPSTHSPNEKKLINLTWPKNHF